MRTCIALVAIAVAFTAACGDNSSSGGVAGGAGVATPSGGSMSVGGAGGAGMSSASGGRATGGAGTSSSGAGKGGAATGGSGGAGGSAGSGVNASGAGGNGAMAGTVADGGEAGAGMPSAGGGAGGAASGGAGSAGAPSGGGGNGTAGGTATGCTRDLLKSTRDAYFTALAAHEPGTLPLADNVKFTENGEVSEIGTAGLWTTAGTLKHVHSAYDTESCNVASQAVVPDGNTDVPMALRLKLVDGKLTEVESIVPRQGDYSVASNTNALTMSATSAGWEDPVPSAMQNTHEEISAWMNKYFRMFPTGVCNVTSDCKRIENGGGNYNCNAGASCTAGEPGPNDNALTPRLILADVETGLGIGFTMFQGQYADMHLFKMYGDQVHGVSAILASADQSGW